MLPLQMQWPPRDGEARSFLKIASTVMNVDGGNQAAVSQPGVRSLQIGQQLGQPQASGSWIASQRPGSLGVHKKRHTLLFFDNMPPNKPSKGKDPAPKTTVQARGGH